MHEFSLALGLTEELKSIARKEGEARVKDVHISIGALSGIVRESFEWGFEVIKESESFLKDAKLLIETEHPAYKCIKCGYTVEEENIPSLLCPVCKGTEFLPLGGDDLRLMRVELEIE